MAPEESLRRVGCGQRGGGGWLGGPEGMGSTAGARRATRSAGEDGPGAGGVGVEREVIGRGLLCRDARTSQEAGNLLGSVWCDRAG